MTNYAFPPGYAGPLPVTTDRGTPPPAPPAPGRIRTALRRMLALVGTQVRVAGAPWDGARPRPTASAVVDRCDRSDVDMAAITR